MSDTITAEDLRQALVARLEASHVEITDMSGGCGQAFSSVIVSPQFRSLNPLKRHRLVNSALKAEIARIHAWSAKCQTPEEWEAEADAGARTGAEAEQRGGPPSDATDAEGKAEGVRA